MKLLFILTLLFSLQTADAQLGKRLKDKVKQTAERKADQKTDEVINNIRCETGKKKIETMLRNADGVISAMIDNDNGNLYLSQENSDVRNKVIEIIRQNGFEADTKKPTKSIADPCK